MNACRKHESAPPAQQDAPIALARNDDGSIQIIRQDVTEGSDTSMALVTKLGRRYNNPFRVANVLQAWNDLSTNDLTTLAPTHRYLKFRPATLEHMKLLSGDIRIRLTTFPLDYEIIKFGQYMQDPATLHNGISEYYACVPVDVPLPAVPYTLIDQLYLTPYQSIVTERAFALAGESAQYAFDRAAEPNPAFDNIGALSAPPKETFDPLSFPPQTGSPAPPYNGIPGELLSTCNCNLNSDNRQPSGCIKVEETQYWPDHARQGVRDVMVEYVGPLFQWAAAWTDANGCYRSDHKIYHRRPWPFSGSFPVYARVRFVSSRKTVKGIKNTPWVDDYAFELKDELGNVAPNLNNVDVTYLRSTSTTANATVYYIAATSNNSIYEFDGYAQQDGILKPPTNIKLLVHRYASAGTAPMFDKLIASGSPGTIITFASINVLLAGVPVVGGWGIQSLITAFPPDIGIGFNWTADHFTSDRIREVVYHELGHSSHYAKCGNQIWEANIAYVVSQLGYGDGTQPGASRCALIEAWGYHIGYDYSHRRYGYWNHSNNFPSGPTNATSWVGSEEAERFVWTYIPSGLMRDLMDDPSNYSLGVPNPVTENSMLQPAGLHPDRIRNYTNAMFQSQMGPWMGSIGQWRAELKVNHPPVMVNSGNTGANYDEVFHAYGM